MCGVRVVSVSVSVSVSVCLCLCLCMCMCMCMCTCTCTCTCMCGVCVLTWLCACDVCCGVVCSVGGVCVVRMINDTASLSWHVRTMHLIGWQNTWEQAPGVPATPSPP